VALVYGKLFLMNGTDHQTGYFGRQVRKERRLRGWSLPELSERTGIDAGHWSRIETGKRPPTAKIAAACDRVFPERRGWFAEYYEESQEWTPSYFKDWGEHEDAADALYAWMTSSIHGLLQTENYARGLLEKGPGAASEVAERRLASRMERQRRLFERGVRMFFVVDELALYREVVSPEVMAAQCRHLVEVAAMPNVTLQVLPAIGHGAEASGFLVATDAAYAEHVLTGGVYAGHSFDNLARMFDSLRAEAWRASDSAAYIGDLETAWATGESPLTQIRTAVTASKLPAVTVC
jgi:hypothetical protein